MVEDLNSKYLKFVCHKLCKHQTWHNSIYFSRLDFLHLYFSWVSWLSFSWSPFFLGHVSVCWTLSIEQKPEMWNLPPRFFSQFLLLSDELYLSSQYHLLDYLLKTFSKDEWIAGQFFIFCFLKKKKKLKTQNPTVWMKCYL